MLLYGSVTFVIRAALGPLREVSVVVALLVKALEALIALVEYVIFAVTASVFLCIVHGLVILSYLKKQRQTLKNQWCV